MPEPRWWVRDIVIASIVAILTGGIISGATIWQQAKIDDARGNRDKDVARQQFLDGQQSENLRFVRDASSPDRAQPRPFDGLDLSDQLMSGLQLAGADFDDADLSRAVFVGTDLAGARFSGASLTEANFSFALHPTDHADPTRRPAANLVGADFAMADLHTANLSGAKMERAILKDADLTNATLNGTNLTGVVFDGTEVYRTDFTEARLYGADLRGAKNLATAKLDRACHDASTRWPDRFTPPPSSRNCT